MSRSIPPMLLVGAAALANSACAGARLPALETRTPAASTRPDERSVYLSQPPALADDDEYVVRVLAGDVACSGALIAEDQVLTAHHCLARRSTSGKPKPTLTPAGDVVVELGGDYLPWGEARVRAVVAPPCGYRAGEGDIAILVLDRELSGLPTVVPALDYEPVLGERVRPIGFGRCALSSDGIRRRRLTGGSIDQLWPGRFRAKAAICPGDSGGPAILEDRDLLVGVVSSSVLDGSEATVGNTEFIRLDRWRPVFATAQLISDGVAPAEIPPLQCPID